MEPTTPAEPTPRTSRRLRRLAGGVAATAAMGVGVLGFTSVDPLGIASAQSGEETTEEGAGPAHVRPGPRALLAALDELVADGTLTQAQADAVIETTREHFDGRPDGPGHHGPKGRFLQNAVAVASETIGITPEELREATADGTTVAEVAEANGVDRQSLIDALVEAGMAAIDERVEAGELDEDRAAELEERLPEAAERFVDHSR